MIQSKVIEQIFLFAKLRIFRKTKKLFEEKITKNCNFQFAISPFSPSGEV